MHSHKLTYEQRMKLPKEEFALERERKYPIEDEAHARNALARVSAYGTEEEKREVCRKVHERYPEIHSEFCELHK